MGWGQILLFQNLPVPKANTAVRYNCLTCFALRHRPQYPLRRFKIRRHHRIKTRSMNFRHGSKRQSTYSSVPFLNTVSIQKMCWCDYSGPTLFSLSITSGNCVFTRDSNRNTTVFAPTAAHVASALLLDSIVKI